MRDQLYSEVMAGAWYVVPAKSDLVFSDPKDLWSTLVRGGDLQETEAGQASGPSGETAGEQMVAGWRLH